MKDAVFQALDRLGIAYNFIEHEPIRTMDEGKAIAEKLGVTPCKCLFLLNRQGEHFLLLLMPNKKMDTKEMARQLKSSHLSFASASDLMDYLHATPGAASPLGLLFDRAHKVKLVVDNDLLNQEYVGVHPCVNTCSVGIKTAELFGIFLIAVTHADYIAVQAATI